MHWIQTIRENLRLSRKELADYLRVSVEMIKSVELNRRELPVDSLQPAITLFQAIEDAKARGPVNDPIGVTDDDVRRVKRVHYQYRRRLERCTVRLEEMQRTHANACFCLAVYYFLAQTLTPPDNENDFYCLKLIQFKIEETVQLIEHNDRTMQRCLDAEITGLKTMVQELERSRAFRGE